VEQLGAGSRSEGVQACLQAAFELIRTHLGWTPTSSEGAMYFEPT
jgi:hypothetical protein